MNTQELAKWIFGYSGTDAAADLRGDLTDFAKGSQNLIPDGAKQSRPFKGLTANGSGSRLMVQLKDTYGGLDDVGGNTAAGSLYAIIADALMYCGNGQVSVEGVNIPGAVATNVLRILLKFNGSYSDPLSGPYAVGMPKPEAVSVGTVPNGLYGATGINGTRSVKYARFNKYTGDKSRSSDTSAVITLDGRLPYAVVPLPSVGQTHHIFFETEAELGGIGLHFRNPIANPFTQSEYAEEDVQRTADNLTIYSDNYFDAAAGTFSAGDIGKRVAAVSGFTVPNPTTVTEIVSSSRIKLSNNITATGGAVSAELIAFAAGIDRSVVLSGKDSDLVEEVAWIYDFEPPTCSHAFQLENRNYVATFAESKDRESSASSESPGTALLPSIPNAFGSYDPRYPIYLPEKVVDVLSDGMGSYKFIAGENGFYAIQAINVDYGGTTPATLTVLLRGEGIKKPHNWCAAENAIYAYTSEPVRITEGGAVDKTFANKIRALMRNWVSEKVVVSSLPKGAVYSHGAESYFYERSSGRWSTSLDLAEWAQNRTAMSAVSVKNRLLITMDGGGGRNAYWFDEGNGSYVCGIGQYQNSPAPSRYKTIQAIRAEFVADRTDRTIFLGIHANNLPAFIKDASMTAGSNALVSPSSNFSHEFIGSYVLVRGAGAGGKALFGRILDIVSPTKVLIGTPVDDFAQSTALNASAAVTNKYCLLAYRIFPIAANRKGTIEVEQTGMFFNFIHSYAASLMQETAGVGAQPLEIEVAGIVDMTEGNNLTSATFGVEVA